MNKKKKKTKKIIKKKPVKKRVKKKEIDWEYIYANFPVVLP